MSINDKNQKEPPQDLEKEVEEIIAAANKDLDTLYIMTEQ
jgi:hypothetical protein